MVEQKSSWRIVKVHAIYHYVADIMRGGITKEYSAELWESLHKNIMKNPYRGSNKKRTEDQILNHHTHQWSLNQIQTLMEGNVEDVDKEVTF